jgi:hypothetical protein
LTGPAIVDPNVAEPPLPTFPCCWTYTLKKTNGETVNMSKIKEMWI